MSTLGDLTPRDIGRKVEITGGKAAIVGQLIDFSIDTEWITELRLCDNPDDAEPIAGRRTMTITVGAWRTSRLPLSTEVTFR